MAEDITAILRVGTSVILVAGLIAIILNLMTLSQSILSGGQSTLQAGVSQISIQDFKAFDQQKLSGTIVRSALSLYEGRDVAIVVRTNACKNNDPAGTPWAYNYGAVLEGSTVIADAATGNIHGWASGAAPTWATKAAGESSYTCNLLVQSGSIVTDSNKRGINYTGGPQYILDGAIFLSELIKDKSGKIIGIMFTQMG